MKSSADLLLLLQENFLQETFLQETFLGKIRKGIENGKFGGRKLTFDQCKFGRPWKKKTLIWTNIREDFLSPEKEPEKFLCKAAHPCCPYTMMTGGHQQRVECGGGERGINFSQLPPAFCDELMRAVFRQHNQDRIIQMQEKMDREEGPEI